MTRPKNNNNNNKNDEEVKNPRVIGWVFTWNNYTESDIRSIALAQKTANIQYIAYGKEVGESGTPHLQGYIRLVKDSTRSALVKVGFIKCWLGPAKTQDPAYCFKGIQSKSEWEKLGILGPNYGRLADTTELGTRFASKQGKRTDLEEVTILVQQGERRVPWLCLNYPTVMLKATQHFTDMMDYLDSEAESARVALTLKEKTLFPWQTKLLAILKTDPELTRTVHFVVDLGGNGGKTLFTNYMTDVVSPSDPSMLTGALDGGRIADTVMVLSNMRPKPKILILDVPRDNVERVQYGMLEKMKNGRITKSKFASKPLRFASPHIVVMMNEFPPPFHFSKDLFVVHQLDNETHDWKLVPYETLVDIEKIKERGIMLDKAQLQLNIKNYITDHS